MGILLDLTNYAGLRGRGWIKYCKEFPWSFGALFFFTFYNLPPPYHRYCFNLLCRVTLASHSILSTAYFSLITSYAHNIFHAFQHSRRDSPGYLFNFSIDVYILTPIRWLACLLLEPRLRHGDIVSARCIAVPQSRYTARAGGALWFLIHPFLT